MSSISGFSSCAMNKANWRLFLSLFAINFINYPQLVFFNEAVITSLEEKEADALEMAAQEDEENKAPEKAHSSKIILLFLQFFL